jgi:hypothetical protein
MTGVGADHDGLVDSWAHGPCCDRAQRAIVTACVLGAVGGAGVDEPELEENLFAFVRSPWLIRSVSRRGDVAG